MARPLMTIARAPIYTPDDDDDDDAAVAATAIANNRARREARPVRVGRDEQRIAGLARVLPNLRGELAARGIQDENDLLAALDNRASDNRFTPPPPPADSVSPLYSDVEVFDVLTVDTKTKDIATVAISSTADTTLDQLPCKWYFTDITVGGAVAASGDEFKVEMQVLLGTRIITIFRLDSVRRTASGTMVNDALQKLYSHMIGPNSTVKLRVVNGNAGVGQTFTGYVQYTYRPANADAMAQAVKHMVIR